MNQLFVERKRQSSLNRFFTESRWGVEDVVQEGGKLLLNEEEIDQSTECKVVDDAVCRKYGSRTEMVCCNYSSTMGTVLSHDCVTSLYVNSDGVWLQDGLRLYGSERRCRERGAEFKTKVQLACELVDEHELGAGRTMWLWDSWYMVRDTVERCRAHGYSWTGGVRSSRMVFYESRRHRLQEPVERLLSEGGFHDVVVDGESCQACKVEVFTPKIGRASIVMDVRADAKGVHTLCTDLLGCGGVEEVVGHALRRGCVDQFYREARFLGLGEYRFRGSEAALIHALVSLAHALLDVLRRRLPRYGVVGKPLSLEAAVEWVRRKTMHFFMRRAREAATEKSTRSILRLIDTS